MKDEIETIEQSPTDVPGGNAPAAVVGIGASAGGLKALQRFFEAVPTDSGMAYVVIMHLDPDRESRIAELLQDRTAVPVTQVTGETKVVADRIYVIPPEQDLTMEGTTIRIQDRGGRPQHAPIDLFFRTLASAYGANAIGVVLSGTGTDGTSGSRFIKENGGITVAQTPEEAEYAGMPESAIGTGQVDLVLQAAQIPAELIRMRQMPSPLQPESLPADTDAHLKNVFAVLRGKTGHDFSLYKRSMVLRRLERRLRFSGRPTLEEYVPLLRESETESRALLRDLLISVSGFFRDPEAFRTLAAVIPNLFEEKTAGDAVRVWVVGCATGEEAYSIAILLHEHAGTMDNPPRIQIFATDIDEDAYSWGREGLYPASALAEVPPERVRRFFTQEGGHYRISKSLRESVLFAVHNVLHDAPFSRLDLVSCRNLLIYLQPEAQAQALETFHYALRQGGLLLLGKAEATGETGLFSPVAEPQRLYRRQPAPRLAMPRLSAADPPAPPDDRSGNPTDSRRDRRPNPFSYGALHLRMLEAYGPPSLVVDEGLNVVHRSDRSGEYLHFGAGKPSHNVIELARGDLRMELRTALHQAFDKGLSVKGRIRKDGSDGGAVNLHVHPPIVGEEGSSRFALVVFDEVAEAEPVAGLPDEPVRRDAVAHLENELKQKREQLESTSAACDRTVQELQAANEELQSVNEEQKAATEELETSREEIQSMNEELTTINQEHQNTIEELKRTNADLQNLIESTEIATVFLDGGLRVRRFTPTAAALLNFVATDEGRPLAHIKSRLDYPTLVEDVESVLSSLVRIEREVSSDAGEWYIVRINPYRSVDDDIDGAIVTFFNNTARKLIEDELRVAKAGAERASLTKGTFLATASHEFRTPLNGIVGYASLLDLDGPLTPAQAYRVDRIQALGGHLTALLDEILTIAKLRSGGLTAESELLDPRRIAIEAAQLIEPAVQAKKLAFVLDLPDEVIEMETDAGKLRHILVNLCGNAVKYTEYGEIRLRVQSKGPHVVIEVRDTGVGIAPENLDRIFEPFWQVDSEPTRIVDGMGIGLATAREYADILGAHLEAESVVGAGTTFRLRLPRSIPPQLKVDRRLATPPLAS